MANNKDFKVKSGIEATNIVEGLGTIGADVTTPSGSFSTTLYTGSGATQSIATGVDLSGSNEGLVWIKGRDSGGYSHHWFDTLRGATKYIKSDTTNAEQTDSNMLTGFTSTGFNLGSTNATNYSTGNFVAWTWKSAANFFDVVTYTGNGVAGKTIAHNLGSVPGMIIVKKYNDTDNWFVYHRGLTDNTYRIMLNSTSGQAQQANAWNSTTPTSSVFTVGDNGNTNASGDSYVAYLFAHNTDTISNGNYTGNGNASGPTVDIGFEPQWLMIKRIDSGDGWAIADTARGFDTSGTINLLRASDNSAEVASQVRVKTTSTGFQIVTTDNEWNANNGVYIYMAIKKAVNESLLDLSTGSVFNFTPTSNTQIKLTNPAPSGTVSQATLLYNGGDAAGVADKYQTTLYTGSADGNPGGEQNITTGIDLANNEGMIWFHGRSGSTVPHMFDTVRGANVRLRTDRDAASDTVADLMTGFRSDGFSLGVGTTFNNGGGGGATYVAFTFRSAPDFFDIVTYTGNASVRTISHNLGAVPGMIVIKKTSGGGDWMVYHRGNTGAPETDVLKLHSTVATTDNAGNFNDTAPTSTEFTVGGNGDVNADGETFIAYLWSHNTSTVSCGGYTGNGNTSGPTVNCGFEPQWIMIKNSNTGSGNWEIYDTVRGIPDGAGDKHVDANTSTAEATGGLDRINVTSTGFSLATTAGELNGNNDKYVYVAIAKENQAVTTYNDTIDWPGGTAPTSPAIGETDVLTFSTSDGGATYKAVHAIDGAK